MTETTTVSNDMDTSGHKNNAETVTVQQNSKENEMITEEVAVPVPSIIKNEMTTVRKGGGDGDSGGLDCDSTYSLSVASDEFDLSTTASTSSSTISGRSSSLRSSGNRSNELKLLGRSSMIDRKSLDLLDELTINKLNFNSVGLVGREKELETMKSSYHSLFKDEKPKMPPRRLSSRTSSVGSGWFTAANKTTTTRELVLIKGCSGVGKSRLVRELKNDVPKTSHGIFAQGKFDFNAKDDPFSGITKALRDIIDQVNQANDNDSSIMTDLGNAIQSHLGEDVKVLIPLISELTEITQVSATTDKPTENSVAKVKEAPLLSTEYDNFQGRFKHCFRLLVRAMTSVLYPLVFVLDDLQCTDVASLDLLDFLLCDVRNPNPVMIVGCYRSNEVDENSVLYNKIQSLHEKKSSYDFNLTEIELHSSTEDDVNEMIMSMLSIDDPSRTQGLAKVCHQRTLGNALFLFEFMKMLVTEELLTYNLGTLQWIWDDDTIAMETTSAPNVVELLRSRMDRLSETELQVLKYASCLGSTFQVKTLEHIWKHRAADMDANEEILTEAISFLQRDNFIEKHGKDGEYRWAHDRIQEAALSLLGSRATTFQYEIGVSLYFTLDEMDLEDSLFDVADLINKHKVKAQDNFALLNLKAAKKARSISAFHSAAKFAAKGIDWLPDNKWEAHRELTLQLYSIGADMELAIGECSRFEMYCNSVLQRQETTAVEALPFKVATMRKMNIVDLRFEDSIDIGISALKDLGCNLLWGRKTTPIQAIVILMRTIQLAKKAPPVESINSVLGTMTDQKQQQTMDIINRICYAAFSAEKRFLGVIGVCKTVELTLKYGIGELSSSAFAALGQMVSMVQKDYDTAARFARIGLEMEKAHRTVTGTQVVYCAYYYCLCWKEPIKNVCDAFNDSYVTGMRLGDNEFGLWSCINAKIMLPYLQGRKLTLLVDQCQDILTQMNEVSAAEQAFVLKMFWQLILNMQEGIVSLEGEIFSASKFEGTSGVLLGTIHLLQGELQVFYDVEAAADRALSRSKGFEKFLPGCVFVMIETFHRGVALYAMARRTGKRRFKSEASKIRKAVQKWARQDNPNVSYYVQLLDAEHYALRGDYDRAAKSYNNSVLLAARTGHLQHAGLCNERYADFLRSCGPSKEENAKYRLSEAIRFYSEWGAVAKADLLTAELESDEL